MTTKAIGSESNLITSINIQDQSILFHRKELLAAHRDTTKTDGLVQALLKDYGHSFNIAAKARVEFAVKDLLQTLQSPKLEEEIKKITSIASEPLPSGEDPASLLESNSLAAHARTAISRDLESADPAKTFLVHRASIYQRENAIQECQRTLSFSILHFSHETDYLQWVKENRQTILPLFLAEDPQEFAKIFIPMALSVSEEKLHNIVLCLYHTIHGIRENSKESEKTIRIIQQQLNTAKRDSKIEKERTIDPIIRDQLEKSLAGISPEQKQEILFLANVQINDPNMQEVCFDGGETYRLPGGVIRDYNRGTSKLTLTSLEETLTLLSVPSDTSQPIQKNTDVKTHVQGIAKFAETFAHQNGLSEKSGSALCKNLWQMQTQTLGNAGGPNIWGPLTNLLLSKYQTTFRPTDIPAESVIAWNQEEKRFDVRLTQPWSVMTCLEDTLGQLTIATNFQLHPKEDSWELNNVSWAPENIQYLPHDIEVDNSLPFTQPVPL